jgi:putative transposase
VSFPDVFRRRRLPHWDVPGAIYFVTACLFDSIPAQGLVDIDQYRRKLHGRPPPSDLSPDEWKSRQWKLTFARADDWLDARPASRHLEKPSLAACVADSMAYFEGERYDVYAYVVMPSHFHWVFRPSEEWLASIAPGGAGLQPAVESTRQVENLPHARCGAGLQPAVPSARQVENLHQKEAKVRTPRERIMHSIKRHSARQCNKLLGTQGPFWQDESYDHCVFDLEELGRIIEYIEQNPVRAGLVQAPQDWPFSSARYRLERNIPIGHPLGRSRK